jgi:glycosyltransferase involved in cell wall biosynthesis
MNKRMVVVGLSYPHMMKLFRKIFEDKYRIDTIDLYGINSTKTAKKRFIKIIWFYIALLGSIIWFLFNRRKITKLIVISGPNIFAYPFLKLASQKTDKMYMPYDIAEFVPAYNFLSRLDKKLERKNFNMADKIIHKGLRHELKSLSFYDEIKHKKEYFFGEYMHGFVIPKTRSKKLSETDVKIHVIYGGTWGYKRQDSVESSFNMYKPLMDNGIHFHLYSYTINPKEIKMLRNYEKKNKYFHYEGFLSSEKLAKEYEKYDYGASIYTLTDKKLRNSMYIRTNFSNKLYDFMKSGLPIIALDTTEAIANLIRENKIGFVFSADDVYSKKEKFEVLKDKEKKKEAENNVNKFVKKHTNSKKFMEFVDN